MTGTVTHGLSRTRTYITWSSMIQRGTNPRDPNYFKYGGAGITVCKRWLKFANFLADMGVRPEGKTLERVRGHLGYKPSNCKWATPMEQNQNRKGVHWITYKGKTLTFRGWAEHTDIPESTLRARILRSKWSVKKSLTTPVQSNKVG